MDSVERYLEVFEGLRRSKRWSTDTNILRFAALTLAAADVVDTGADVEATAKALVDEAGGFSPLAFSIAAGVVLAEEAEKMESLEDPAAAANLRAVQAIIEAQQAAMIACMAACVATTSAST